MFTIHVRKKKKKKLMYTRLDHIKKTVLKNETVKCCFYIRHNYKCGVEKKKTYAIITKKMDIITKLFREKYF